MPTPEEIETVLKIVSDMTTAKKPPFVKSQWEDRWLRRGGEMFMHGFLGSIGVLAVAIAAVVVKSDALRATSIALQILASICLILFWGFSILASLPGLFKLKKEPYYWFLELISTQMKIDARRSQVPSATLS